MKISQKDRVYIIDMYKNHLKPMKQLANEFNVTRQAIYKILKASNVNTRKRKLPVSCSCCGKTNYRTKASIRRSKRLFCGQECYTAYLNAGGRWKEDRNGSRLARRLVKAHFKKIDKRFRPEYIVHHKDGNQSNNILKNLIVFANQGDHVRHHRGIDVEIVWDGASIKIVRPY